MMNILLSRETDEERELFSQIAEGNEQAFGIFFYKYLSILKPFVKRFAKSDEATEDIIQTTFIRVWLNREKLPDVANVHSWLYKFASYESLNYIRTSSIKNKHLNKVANNRATEYQFNYATSDNVNVNEINELVAKAVNRLSKQRKKIYELSRTSGMAIPDIANELQISPNTVKNALVISLKSIRDYLSHHGYSYSLLFILFMRNN